MRRQEIVAAVAVVLYIVFFSMPPPAFVSAILNNVVGMIAAFAGAVYVTLYKSKIVGGLLLLTLVLSISRGGREGFDASLGKFMKAKDSDSSGDDAVYFIPTGKQERYTLGGCNPCGTENLCTNLDRSMTTIEIEALTDKGAFECSLISTDGGNPGPEGGDNPPDRVPGDGQNPPGDSTTEPPLPPEDETPNNGGSGGGSAGGNSNGTGTANGTAPVMSCNLESYANYKRSGQTDFAAF